MKTYVLYHDNCRDGFGAAWAAWKSLGDTATYIAVTYNQSPPIMEPKSKIYIVDFSYPRDIILELIKQYNITIIDHHKTAATQLTDIPCETIFDMTHSGASLTWTYFHSSPPPKFIEIIEAGDLWKKDYPDLWPLLKAIDSLPYTFYQWSKFELKFDQDYSDLLVQGKTLLQKEQNEINELVKNINTTPKSETEYTLKKLGGIIIQLKPDNKLISKICEKLLEIYNTPFSAAYIEDEGKRRWSLRSNNKIDVSIIAQSFGGGGHPNAAGFSEPIED